MQNPPGWIDHHADFVERLHWGYEGQQHLAVYLRRSGREVTVPPLEVARSYREAPAYRDRGDIFVDGKRYDSKRLDIPFTGAHDFPHRQLLVVRQDQLERSDPQPIGFYILNRPVTHCAFVRLVDRDQWWLWTIKSEWDGKPTPAYFCKLSLPKWRDMR